MGSGALDGRPARRERNRASVVAAMLALLDEGALEPTLEQVAARAGVSQRSVFRYFANGDDLLQAVIRTTFERAAPLLVVPAQGRGPLDGRVACFTDSRVRLWAALAGPARAARLRVPSSVSVAAEASRFRELLDAQVRGCFAEELSRLDSAAAEELVLMIDVLVSFEAWDLLVVAHARTTPQVALAWSNTLRILIGHRQTFDS